MSTTKGVVAGAILAAALVGVAIWHFSGPESPSRSMAPMSFMAAATISNINVAVNCSTSVLINFNTSTITHAYVEYGTTTGYGSTTIDDTVRLYSEHAIQLTGLVANTLYHYRIIAVDASSIQTVTSDQTVTTVSSGATCPALPSQVDSRMPDMTGAVNKTVKTSGGDYTPAQFQTALNDAGTANEKRFITVDSGLTLTGQWTMPANADGNWIIIRSSAHASLTEGKRVSPADTSNMFKIQNTNTDPPIIFAAASNHIRIIGAEITIDPNALANAPNGVEQSGLIDFRNALAGSAANLATFIGVDRCYVHGQSTKNTRRGIFLAGEDLFVIDSYVSEFHATGSDAQAILGGEMKRVKILNNTLIGSGENFMWGGFGISIPGYVVGELEYLRNQMYHPIEWKNNGPSYGGFRWITKNLFELKTSSKVFMFGNYFGGTAPSQGGYWPDAQSLSINLKLEQNSVGPTTCDLMQDIVVYKNWGRNLAAGIAVVGRTVSAQGCTNNAERVLLSNNVWEYNATTWTPADGASSGSWNAGGGQWSSTEDLQIIHNSWVNATPTQTNTCDSIFTNGSVAIIGEPTESKWGGLIVKDNFIDFRACGISGSGNIVNATGALDAHFTGWIFTNNGILRSAGAAGNFPAGQVFATSWNAQLVNFNNGIGGDYQVAASSSWHNAASDGSDIGANVPAVVRATEFAPTGNWGTPVPTPTPTTTPTPTPTATPTPTPIPTPTPSPPGICKPNQLLSTGCTCPVPPRRILGPANKQRCK